MATLTDNQIRDANNLFVDAQDLIVRAAQLRNDLSQFLFRNQNRGFYSIDGKAPAVNPITPDMFDAPVKDEKGIEVKPAGCLYQLQSAKSFLMGTVAPMIKTRSADAPNVIANFAIAIDSASKELAPVFEVLRNDK
jgi:hypothetical protein